MIEQSILDQALGAIGHASWPVLIGYMILVVVGLWRSITHERFVGRPGDWSSAVSTMLGGVGLALAAGGVWWQTLAIALLAAPSSSGFWRLVRGSIPIIGVDALVLVSVMSLLSGCGAICSGARGVSSAIGEAQELIEDAPVPGSIDAKLELVLDRAAAIAALAELIACEGVSELPGPAESAKPPEDGDAPFESPAPQGAPAVTGDGNGG